MSFIYSVLHSIGFNWHVALANFINFLIILFILNKFFFKKVSKTIQDRNEMIKSGLSNAEDAEKKLKEAENQKSEIISLAKKDGESIVQKSAEKAENLANEIKTKAEKEADALRSDLKNAIENAKGKVEMDFAKEAPILLANMLKATLSKNLTEEEHNKMVTSLIK